MSFVVAIDGPAGTGKGTVTEILSRKMHLINVDTGAMYRCVTIEMLNRYWCNVQMCHTRNVK